MYHADQTVECVDVENSLIENQKKENKQQKEKECTLNQVSPLTIIHSFNVKSVDQQLTWYGPVTIETILY